MIQELIAPEQLEDRYGGLNPAKEDNFWPPSVPNNNFGAWTEDEQVAGGDNSGAKGEEQKQY